MQELTIVGSGTAAPEPQRVGSAYFVRAAGLRLLLDCGPGAVHHLARFELPWPRLTHLLLTHFHTDHVGDVATLLFGLRHGLREPRTEPLQVLGPAGTRDFLERLAAAHGDFVTDPGFPLHIRELTPGDALELADGATLRTCATRHTEGSLGYRLDAGGASLGYTGDTGERADHAEFFRDVDVLVAECSLPEEDAIDTHLTPGRLGRLAAAARPGQLIVTHVYPQLAERDIAGLLRAAGWEGATLRARDGLRLTLGDANPPDA
jgi:ribonuclease BN (tRNA processing enzyme)